MLRQNKVSRSIVVKKKSMFSVPPLGTGCFHTYLLLGTVEHMNKTVGSHIILRGKFMMHNFMNTKKYN
jgi:hypothetical protein